jgi:hypothetical protein
MSWRDLRQCQACGTAWLRLWPYSQPLAGQSSIFLRAPIQVRQEDLPMSDKFWLTEAQLTPLKPYFPRSRGIPRVDDQRVISGIIHVIWNRLRWRDAPEVYGAHKILYV